MQPKIDKKAGCVTCNGKGLICIDQVPLFRIIRYQGEIWLSIRDQHGPRSDMRGTDSVMIPLDLFIAKLFKVAGNM